MVEKEEMKTFDSSETDEQMVHVVEGESSSNKAHKKKKKKRRQSDYAEEGAENEDSPPTVVDKTNSNIEVKVEIVDEDGKTMDTFSDMVSICKGKKKKRTDKTDTSDVEGLQTVEEASS